MGPTVDGASEPKVNPGWVPPDDLVFQYLLREAVAGHVPVYFASVPIQRLQRFSPGFHPETTEGGAEVVAAIMSRWRAGDFAKMWVYPDGDHFVVADDYFTLAAAETGRPDFVPCWVLGAVPQGSAKDVQGPMGPDWVKRTVLSSVG